ncbi:MAG: FAD-dependent monooxygenase [Aeromicrobium sp.]
MRLGSVAVIGGGPGGLFAARLLKLRHPACRVDVYEGSEPGRTFGFGVGLATKTQRNLQAADPETLAAIVARSWAHDMSMSVGAERVRLPGGNLLAIGRSTLLEVLHDQAVAAGVEVHFGVRAEAGEVTADLVVVADGINSATREQHAEALGARIATDRDLYLWCGTEFALPSAVFAPVHTEAGTFVAHAYPYAPDRSTFLIETDEQTWRRAGFDATTEATPADSSDQTALTYLQEAFEDELQGHRLIGNRTRWTRFRTVTCDRWHVGSTVLIGDAAHTAHYSIGSGTKLAMEDAIVLAQVVDEADSVAEALQSYERMRRPAVEHLQQTAARSMRWWSSFPSRLDQPVAQLLISYMSRAGKVSVDRFAESAPEVVRAGLAEYAGTSPDPGESDLAGWIVDQPFRRDGWDLTSRVLDQAAVVGRVALEDAAGAVRDGLWVVEAATGLDDPWGAEVDVIVKEVAAAVESGAGGAMLRTADDLDHVLTMLDVAERLRRETGAVVVVSAEGRWVDHLAAGLASGRVDLIRLTDGEVSE